ncbi:MAG: hypothetical protein LBQ39_11030 [Tannerellaceae bacterium]|jgi:hypothetical protein|nr:hypothetical protein [Tannerellaceae bacterium]
MEKTGIKWKKRGQVIGLFSLLSVIAFAQQEQAHRKMTVSGYIQGQYQYAEKGGVLQVGAPNEHPGKAFDRIGIRRGRLKVAYEEGIASAVFQLDATEKGVGIKDAYLLVSDPWLKRIALKAGVFGRPFGQEIAYSSSQRESPERATVFRTLFPDERDLGVTLRWKGGADSPLSFLRLEAGWFAGNGIKQETDSRKDFIGQLGVDKGWGRMFHLSVGVSYYNGSVYQGSERVYTMSGGRFVLNDHPDNKGRFAKREYLGFDVRFTLDSPLGKSQLRGEYLTGKQPGSETGSKSPNASQLPSGDVYIRNFRGGYLMLVQGIGKSPFSAVLKYDWYDPNTGTNTAGATTAGDVARSAFGAGAVWQAHKQVRVQAYYEWNWNEKTAHIPAFSEDIRDNLFALRLQYAF